MNTVQTPSLTVEQEVLLLSARTRLEGTARDRLLRALDGPLDWNVLLSLTARHHTTALLHHHVTAVAPERVPTPILQNLRSYTVHLAARNLRVVGESLPLLRDLEAAGAPAVVWKGPALAYSVYPRPELRIFTDLDLLVRRRDVRTVREVVTARGYVVRDQPAESEDELFDRGRGVVTMWNPRAQIGVDLHWGSTWRYASVMDCDHLWTRSESLSVGGSRIRVLEPGWLLFALCAHGAKHGPYPWPTLKWVTDMEAIVRAFPGEVWGPLLARSREVGCHRMLLLGLGLAAELLEAPLPPEVVEALAGDPLVAKLQQPVRERMLHQRSTDFPLSERLRFDLAVRERRRDRVAYALTRILMPTRHDMTAASPASRLLRVPVRLLRLGRRYLLNPSRGRALVLGSGDRARTSDQ
jgi:hypothetical protein